MGEEVLSKTIYYSLHYYIYSKPSKWDPLIMKLLCIEVLFFPYLSTLASALCVSYDYNLKERQCQRMFKLPHNCTCLTC